MVCIDTSSKETTIAGEKMRVIFLANSPPWKLPNARGDRRISLLTGSAATGQQGDSPSTLRGPQAPLPSLPDNHGVDSVRLVSRGGVLPLPRPSPLVDHSTSYPCSCLYLITSSAWYRNVGESIRPRASTVFQVDHQVELVGPFHGQVGWCSAFMILDRLDGGALAEIGNTRPIGQQTACLSKAPGSRYGRQAVPGRQRQEPRPVLDKEGGIHNDERVGPPLHHGGKGRLKGFWVPNLNALELHTQRPGPPSRCCWARGREHAPTDRLGRPRGQWSAPLP